MFKSFVLEIEMEYSSYLSLHYDKDEKEADHALSSSSNYLIGVLESSGYTFKQTNWASNLDKPQEFLQCQLCNISFSNLHTQKYHMYVFHADKFKIVIYLSKVFKHIKKHVFFININL